jgi:hypothetical protein
MHRVDVADARDVESIAIDRPGAQFGYTKTRFKGWAKNIGRLRVAQPLPVAGALHRSRQPLSDSATNLRQCFSVRELGGSRAESD